MSPTVTLKDVAKKAKSNIVSVSRVLNNHVRACEVKKETRARIIAAAQELGYRKNELAATIRTGISRTVALVGDFTGTTTFSLNNVIEGILISATEYDYGVRVYSATQISQYLDEILRYKIKNVIVVSLDKKCRQQVSHFCKKHGLKLVYIFEKKLWLFPGSCLK